MPTCLSRIAAKGSIQPYVKMIDGAKQSLSICVNTKSPLFLIKDKMKAYVCLICGMKSLSKEMF